MSFAFDIKSTKGECPDAACSCSYQDNKFLYTTLM